jgi:hypothetical protein
LESVLSSVLPSDERFAREGSLQMGTSVPS